MVVRTLLGKQFEAVRQLCVVVLRATRPRRYRDRQPTQRSALSKISLYLRPQRPSATAGRGVAAVKFVLNILGKGGEDGQRRWPRHMFSGRIRASTLALIAVFLTVWWLSHTGNFWW